MKKPNIGDYLNFDGYGLLIVHDRDVFKRTEKSKSEYSIMKDLKGEIIRNKDGILMWFYDDFLTVRNFKIK